MYRAVRYNTKRHWQRCALPEMYLIYVDSTKPHLTIDISWSSYFSCIYHVAPGCVWDLTQNTLGMRVSARIPPFIPEGNLNKIFWQPFLTLFNWSSPPQRNPFNGNSKSGWHPLFSDVGITVNNVAWSTSFEGSNLEVWCHDRSAPSVLRHGTRP